MARMQVCLSKWSSQLFESGKNFVKKTITAAVITPMITELRIFSRRFWRTVPSNRSKRERTRIPIIIMITDTRTNRRSLVFIGTGIFCYLGSFCLSWRKKERPVSIATIMVPVIAILPYEPVSGCVSITADPARQIRLKINPALNNFFLLVVLMSYYFFCDLYVIW